MCIKRKLQDVVKNTSTWKAIQRINTAFDHHLHLRMFDTGVLFMTLELFKKCPGSVVINIDQFLAKIVERHRLVKQMT